MSMKRNITLAATVVVMLGGFAEPADACCKFLKDFAEGAVNVVEKGVGGAVKVVGGVVGGAVEVGEEVVGGAVEVGEEVVGGAVEVAGEAVDFALDVTEDTVEVVGEVTSDVLEDTLDTVKVGGETVDFALDVLEIIGEVLDPEVPEAPVATIISRPADENPFVGRVLGGNSSYRNDARGRVAAPRSGSQASAAPATSRNARIPGGRSGGEGYSGQGLRGVRPQRAPVRICLEAVERVQCRSLR